MPPLGRDKPDDPVLAAILNAGALQRAIREGLAASGSPALVGLLLSRYPGLSQGGAEYLESAIHAAALGGEVSPEDTSPLGGSLSNIPTIPGTIPDDQEPSRVVYPVRIQIIDEESGEHIWHDIDIYSEDVLPASEIISRSIAGAKRRYDTTPGGQAPEWIDSVTDPSSIHIGVFAAW